MQKLFMLAVVLCDFTNSWKNWCSLAWWFQVTQNISRTFRNTSHKGEKDKIVVLNETSSKIKYMYMWRKVFLRTDNQLQN